MKRILLLTMHILPGVELHQFYKNIGQFENLVFVIMSIRESIRLIARTHSLSQLVTINYYRLLKSIITYHLIQTEKTQFNDKGK